MELGVVDGSESVELAESESVESEESGVVLVDCGVALLVAGLLMERGEAEDGED